jgi:hypothetical protein
LTQRSARAKSLIAEAGEKNAPAMRSSLVTSFAKADHGAAIHPAPYSSMAAAAKSSICARAHQAAELVNYLYFDRPCGQIANPQECGLTFSEERRKQHDRIELPSRGSDPDSYLKVAREM